MKDENKLPTRKLGPQTVSKESNLGECKREKRKATRTGRGKREGEGGERETKKGGREKRSGPV